MNPATSPYKLSLPGAYHQHTNEYIQVERIRVGFACGESSLRRGKPLPFSRNILVKNILLIYLATLVTLLIVDLAYLGTVGIKLFRSQLGPSVLREKPLAGAAILFYVIYVAGLVGFVVVPSASNGIAGTAIYGAMLGFVAYGTYDLTNMATLARWTWLLVALDMLWGTLVTAIAAAAGAYVATKL